MDSDGPLIVFTWWKVVGIVGVLLFTGRWFVQMYYSRKAGKPVTPRLFWIMSMLGSVILLSYFMFSPKRDMVGILSNFFPVFVSAYNLYLDLAHKRKEDVAAQTANEAAPIREIAKEDRIKVVPPVSPAVSGRLALATNDTK